MATRFCAVRSRKPSSQLSNSSVLSTRYIVVYIRQSLVGVNYTIEYQGSGHHLEGGTAAARDAVKKEALRKAGIGYHEVVAGHTTAGELKRLVEKLVPGEQV
jgi:hypothetical protein